MEKIISRIHRIKLPIPFPLKSTNVYYIHDSIPTLIDTGINTDESFDKLSSAIADCGGSLSKIQRIILTHGHPDHMGMAGRLTQYCDAAVYLHQWEQNKLLLGADKAHAFHKKCYLKFLNSTGLSENIKQEISMEILLRHSHIYSQITNPQIIQDGHLFQFDDFNLKTIHCPGHSSGSICLFDKTSEILFAGDTVLNHITPNPAVEVIPFPEAPDYQSLTNYRLSLKKLHTLPISKVFPGHGSPFNNGNDRIKAILNHHIERRRDVINIISNYQADHNNAENGMYMYQISQQLFPNVTQNETFLCLSESSGYLDMLLDENIIKKNITARGNLYSLI